MYGEIAGVWSGSDIRWEKPHVVGTAKALGWLKEAFRIHIVVFCIWSDDSVL